jgi:hypothetical protein
MNGSLKVHFGLVSTCSPSYWRGWGRSPGFQGQTGQHSVIPLWKKS